MVTKESFAQRHWKLLVYVGASIALSALVTTECIDRAALRERPGSVYVTLCLVVSVAGFGLVAFLWGGVAFVRASLSARPSPRGAISRRECGSHR